MDSILKRNHYRSIGFPNDTSTILTHSYTLDPPYAPLRFDRKQAKIAQALSPSRGLPNNQSIILFGYCNIRKFI